MFWISLYVSTSKISSIASSKSTFLYLLHFPHLSIVFEITLVNCNTMKEIC